MTTESERLIAWLSKQGYTVHSLLVAMRYEKAPIGPCLRGEKPFYAYFIWRFAQKFGVETALHLFDVPEHQAALLGQDYSDYRFFPEKTAARAAVNKAVTLGEMPPIKSCKCHGCDKQADVYHHESYHLDDQLNVVPLCRSCHQ